MGLALNALVTVEEARRELRIKPGEFSKDAEIETLISRASGILEADVCDRELMYRGINVGANLKTSAWTNGPDTPSAQPSQASTLRVVIPEGAAGFLIVDGTDWMDQPAQDTFEDAGEHRGAVVFKTVTALTISGAIGSGNYTIDAVIPYQEMHRFREARGYFYVARPPIVTIAQVKENEQAISPERLTVDYEDGRITKYIAPKGLFVDFPEDEFFRFARAGSSQFIPFAIQSSIAYAGGFPIDPLRTKVPEAVKDCCLRVMAHIYREIERKEQGTVSISTQAGSMTRFKTDPVYDEVRVRMAKWINRSTTAAR